MMKTLAKHSKRERNRVKDFIHKLTTTLAKEFKGYILKIGFFLTGKLLKKRLVLAFMVLSHRSMRFLSPKVL
ncbi:MAG: hypothetical protein QXR74_07320 [Candidatus Bathyarchaeia archaeon]